MPERNAITRDYLRSILDYDPETGVFTWRWIEGETRQRNLRYAGKVAGGHDEAGYIAIRAAGKLYRAHRLAFIWMTGEAPPLVDHANGDKDDNRWANLRAATKSQNAANSKPPLSTNACGLKGVYLCRQTGRWRTRVAKDGKTHELGRFARKEDAAEAYEKAVRSLFGEFAPTGTVQE